MAYECFHRLAKPITEDIYDQKFLVSCTFDYRTIVHLDVICDRYDWPRSKLLRYLVAKALSDVDITKVDCLGLCSQDHK